MIDLALEIPVSEEVEVDGWTLKALDEGLADAAAGRTVPIEDVRRMIPEWISRFESQTPR